MAIFGRMREFLAWLAVAILILLLLAAALYPLAQIAVTTVLD